MRKVLLILTRGIAVVVHAAVGIAIWVTIVGVQPWIVGLAMIAWLVGIVLIYEWWSRPARILGLPLVLGTAYFLAVVIGDELGVIGGP